MAKGPSSETIFGRAIEIQSPEERSAYLEQACADPVARLELEKLVNDHFRAGQFLEKPALEATSAAESLCEVSGTTIGSYKLLQQIGEGGMAWSSWPSKVRLSGAGSR